jgi:hypothetical protein
MVVWGATWHSVIRAILCNKRITLSIAKYESIAALILTWKQNFHPKTGFGKVPSVNFFQTSFSTSPVLFLTKPLHLRKLRAEITTERCCWWWWAWWCACCWSSTGPGGSTSAYLGPAYSSLLLVTTRSGASLSLATTRSGARLSLVTGQVQGSSRSLKLSSARQLPTVGQRNAFISLFISFPVDATSVARQALKDRYCLSALTEF